MCTMYYFHAIGSVKSPKSAAFPSVDIVMKFTNIYVYWSISHRPRYHVVDAQFPASLEPNSDVKSPKSTAFPVDAIVT